MKRYIVLGFIIAYGFSCKKENQIKMDLGKAYYPSKHGHWIIYHVDSTYFGTDTLVRSFHIKELVDSIYDDHGNQIQIIKRYSRKADQLNWSILDVWTATVTGARVEKVEENKRIVKMIFPVVENEKWDGNALNSSGIQEYEYEELDAKYILDSLYFDSTVTILQQEENYLTHRWFSKEVYAKNIGMIYFQRDSIHFRTNEGGQVNLEGISVEMRLINHSN